MITARLARKELLASATASLSASGALAADELESLTEPKPNRSIVIAFMELDHGH
jgi:hypothetical protein